MGRESEGWRRRGQAAAWLLAGTALAAGAADPEPVDGLDWDLDERIAAVNEGELRFLPAPPSEPVHHHDNRLTIEPASLAQGWVGLEQCHRNLDPVPRAEIVFRPGRVRALRVLSSSGIQAARVDGPSVQLEGVAPGARLCLSAQTRALEATADGGYVLRSGPYMRRFLDGFYPMRVTLTVRYPCDSLRLVAFQPAVQPGFEPRIGECEVGYDTWFEGRLHTELRFARVGRH